MAHDWQVVPDKRYETQPEAYTEALRLWGNDRAFEWIGGPVLFGGGHREPRRIRVGTIDKKYKVVKEGARWVVLEKSNL